MTALTCEGLCKSFGGVAALDGISLQVPPATITAVIGPNGAGKTTLFNTICGFLRPDAGRVVLGGHPITRMRPYQVARLGVARTFQDLRLVLHISPLENVMLARPSQRGEGLLAALTGVATRAEERRNRDEAFRLLGVVGLANQAEVPSRDLSYGQQKLLTLACCLATEGNLLLLDEPVAGAHPAMAEQILALLRDIQSQGKTVLLIEHDLAAVRAGADHVVVMDGGKVVAQGHTAEVLERSEILEAYCG